MLFMALAVSCVKVRYDILDDYRSAFSVNFVWSQTNAGAKVSQAANACPDSMTVLMVHTDFGSRDTLVMHRTEASTYIPYRDTTLVSGRYFCVAYGSLYDTLEVPMLDQLLQGQGQVSKLKFYAPVMGTYTDKEVREKLIQKLDLPNTTGIRLDFNPLCPMVVDSIAPIYWASTLVNLSTDKKVEVEFAPRLATVDINLSVQFVDVLADTVVACFAGIPQSAYLMDRAVELESAGKSYFRLLPDEDGVFSGSIRTLGLIDSNSDIVQDDGPGILYISLAAEGKYYNYTLDLETTGVLGRPDKFSNRYVLNLSEYTKDLTLRKQDLTMEYIQGDDLHGEDVTDNPTFE